MANGNSSIPPINPGDPSDITNNTGASKLKALRNLPKTPPSMGTPLPPGEIALDRAPISVLRQNSLGPIVNTPTSVGSAGFFLDPTGTGGAISGDDAITNALAYSGANVVDPRVVGETSRFTNQTAQMWESAADRFKSGIVGGGLQGLGALGEDFAGLLGGSFWGEDLERSWLEQNAASAAAGYREISRIRQDDATLYEGLQSAVSSIVEFGAIGKAVSKGARLAAGGVKALSGAIAAGSQARKLGAAIEAGAATTRVSQQVAENGLRLRTAISQGLAGLAESVPAGIIQNRFEGTSMALQTYEEALGKLQPAVLAGQMSLEEAKEIAADQANGVRAKNQAMMLQDIFQYAGFFRARGGIRNGYARPGFTWNPRTYLRNALQSTKSFRQYATNNYIVQGLGEALEEGFQSGLQKDAIRNTELEARDIIKDRGGDESIVPVSNIIHATRSNVLDRFISYGSNSETQFEMKVGFFAGAGQRAIQGYVNTAKDNKEYKKITKQIDAVKQNWPSTTTEEQTKKQAELDRLEAKRAVTSRKGRAEYYETLAKTLKDDVAGAIKFSIETDDLIEVARQKGLDHIVEGIKNKSFFQLFMRHAQAGTVDQLERTLQAVADGELKSDMFPETGEAQTQAKTMLDELTKLEQDFISVQNLEGNSDILWRQYNSQINQKVVDNAFQSREKYKSEIEKDLRDLSGSSAASIEVDLETGELKITDSLGRDVRVSERLKTAVETSEAYDSIFGEGGLNEQIDKLKETIIQDRAEMSQMLTKKGQKKLRQERRAKEAQIQQLTRQLKKARRGGKTSTDRDSSNVTSANRRTQAHAGDSDVVQSEIVTDPAAENENDPEILRDPGAAAETEEEMDDVTKMFGRKPADPTDSVLSDKEIQEEAEGQQGENELAAYGYTRSQQSPANKIAQLLMEYNARVESGIIKLEDAGINNIAAYVGLSDPEFIQEGDTIKFRVVTTDDSKVRDVSDNDETRQGKVKSVKEARARSKELAEHESGLSGETISEEQIIADTEAIEIVLVTKDGNEVPIGFVHSPLYAREARRAVAEGESLSGAISSDKRELRNFRAKILDGSISETKIEKIVPVVLNYVSRGERKTTRATFEGVDPSKYTIAVVNSDGRLRAQGNTALSAKLGRNTKVINEANVKPGMAYVIVPLKKNKDGITEYYAAPLLTSQVSSNDVRTMLGAIEGWINNNNELGAELNSRLNTEDIKGLKTILKRFVRVRSTSEMLVKPGQFLYTKNIKDANGNDQEVLVLRKVVSDSADGFIEVEIKKGVALSQDDRALVSNILSEQYINLDFDSLSTDKHYSRIIKEDGSVAKNDKTFIEHIMEVTKATISPVRDEQGNLAGDRAVYHYNADIRFSAPLEGVSQESEEAVVKPEDAPETESTTEPLTPEQEINKILNDVDEDGIDFGGDEDGDTVNLVPQRKTPRSEETRDRFRLKGVTPVQQEQLISGFIDGLVQQLRAINKSGRVLTEEQKFDEASSDSFKNIIAKLEAIIERTQKQLDKVNSLSATTEAQIAQKQAAISKLEARLKGGKRILAAVRVNEDKLIDLALTKFEQQAGVKRVKRDKRVSKEEAETRSMVERLFGSFSKTKGAETNPEEESEVDEDASESAPGISRNYHSDNFYFTLNPIDTASGRLRSSLMTLPVIGQEGVVKKNFYGEELLADANNVFKILSAALEGSEPIFSEQVDTLLRKYLTDRGFRESAPWLPALILNAVDLESLQGNTLGVKFLEKAFPNTETREALIKSLVKQERNISPQILDEIASVMSKHVLVAPMVSIKTGYEGQVYVNVFSQNRNALSAIVSEEFSIAMRERLYTYNPKTGEYEKDINKFSAAIEYLNNLLENPNVEYGEFKESFQRYVGIDLSEETIASLYEDGIYLTTATNSQRVKMADSAMRLSNNSPFKNLIQHLTELRDKDILYTAKGPTSFGAIKHLVRLEASRSNARRNGSTFYAGGRNIATMTANKYFTKLLDELFTLDDPTSPEAKKIINEAHEIFQGIFEQPSQLLTALLNGEISRDDLEVQYLNFNPLKDEGENSDDFNKLQMLEHSKVKNGLLTASTNVMSSNFTPNNAKPGVSFKQRQATFVPLTFSDKDTVLAVKGLALLMKLNLGGGVTQDTIDLFYNHGLMSEIQRIRAYSKANLLKDSELDDDGKTQLNNRAIEEGGHLFYMFPELNFVEVEFEGTPMKLNEAIALTETEEQLASIEEEIKKALAENLNAMVGDKLNAFEEGDQDYDSIPSAYKELIASEWKATNRTTSEPSPELLMKLVAADMALNQTLGTINAIQLFVGDLAQYYKNPKIDEAAKQGISEEAVQELVERAAIKAAYANIDKRLAALIAPGVEPSRKSRDEKYAQIMVEDIELDYDSEFFEGLPDEFVDYFKGIEATDGQEFITWQEYLDNARSFGEISQELHDQVTSIIEKYNRTETLSEEDKKTLTSVMFRAQKPVGVADVYHKLGDSNSTIRQRVYIKTSAVPLVPMLTKGTQLDNLRIAMENMQGNDKLGMNVRLAFKSGIKLGFTAASSKIKILNEDGNIKSAEELTALFEGGTEGLPYRIMDRKYWKIQQAVPDKTKDEGTRGTQVDALIASAAPMSERLTEIAESFKKNSIKLFTKRAKKLKDELMMDNPNKLVGGKVINREKLGRILTEVAKERGFDFNVIEGLSIGADGNFEIPAELSVASPQFQSMLMAIVRKGIVKKKVTGGSQVLMSEAMFKFQQGIEGQGDIIYTENWEGSLKPMRMENGVVKPAQLILPSKFRDENGKKIDITKLTKTITDPDGTKRTVIDSAKLPSNLLEGFGFRIPSQGYNSMAFVEIVGFLPDYMGDIVVAPRSFMAQMGSDFDVDKLYDYFYKLKKKGKSYEKVTGEDEYGLQNAMLDDRINFLKEKEVYQLVKTPLDFGLHSFKPGSNRYENTHDSALEDTINNAGGMANAIHNKKEAPSKSKQSIISEFYQQAKYLEARAALDAVGVKATLNSFLGVMSGSNKVLNLTRTFTFGKEVQISSISGRNTLDRGKRVSGEEESVIVKSKRLKQEVSSGSLSAAVDNQNEQIINRYNLNNATFDAHDAMELMGLEEDFIQTFLEQPVLVALSRAIMANEYATIKNSSEEMVIKILAAHANIDPSKITLEQMSALYSAAEAEFEEEFGNLTQEEIVSKMFNGIGNSEAFSLPVNAILVAKFAELSAIMSDIRPAIRLLSADSKGAGTGLLDFLDVIHKAEEITEDDNVSSDSLLKLLGDYEIVPSSQQEKIQQLESKGFIKGPRTNKGYLMIKPDSTKSVSSIQALSIAQELMETEFSSMFNLMSHITNNYSFVRLNTRDGRKTLEESIRSYVNSNSNLFAGMTREQLMVKTDDNLTLAEVVELAQSDPSLKNNILIQELETVIQDGLPHEVKNRNSVGEDTVTDAQARAFLELLMSPKQTLIQGTNVTPNDLGRMLIDYAYLTGGVKSAVDFVRFVPTSYLIDLGFYDVLKEGYAALRSGNKNQLVEQMLQNNPDLASKKVRIDNESGVVFDQTSQVDAGLVVFYPSANFAEEAGIILDTSGLYEILPEYRYISVKPPNRPRRILKFNPETGKYEMLDNLGTGTVKEYSYGAEGFSVYPENKVENYLGVEEETEEEIDLDYQPPTELPEYEGGDPMRDPGASTEEVMGMFGRSTPSPQAPIETAEEQEEEQEEFEETTDEEVFTMFGRSDTKPNAGTNEVPGQPLSDTTPTLSTVLAELESKSQTSRTGTSLEQVIEEMVNSSDPAHSYLAREILGNDVIKKKGSQVIFKKGKTVSESSANVESATVAVDSNTGSWEFEQALLHELGHQLTLKEIRIWQNGGSVNPAVDKALSELDQIRETFYEQLLTKDPAKLATVMTLLESVPADLDFINRMAFIDELREKNLNKITELKAKGDLKGVQELVNAGYGALRLEEFVTLVMSNQAFRDVLDSTVKPDEELSLLARVKEALGTIIKTIFELGDRPLSDYALEQTMIVMRGGADPSTGTGPGPTAPTGGDTDTMIVKVNGKDFYVKSNGEILDSSKKLVDKRSPQYKKAEFKAAYLANDFIPVELEGSPHKFYVYTSLDGDIKVAKQTAKSLTMLSPDSKDFKEAVKQAFNTGTEVVQTSPVQPIQQTSEVEIKVSNEKYSRESLDNDPDSMYLFTDNAERTSRPTASSPNITEGWYAEKYKDKTNKPLHFGSPSNPTSAVIRGKNNAYPISTMSAYGTNWTNENFDLFKTTIDDEIAQIKQDLPKFKTLKLGNFRIGQGGRFAKLPSQHQAYLDSKLLELGIDNSGTIPKVIQPTQTGEKVFNQSGNEVKLYGTEIVRAEDGSTYEEFDTVEEAQKAFNAIKQQSQQPGTKPSTQPKVIQPTQTSDVESKVKEAVDAIKSNTESRNAENWTSSLDHPDFPELKGVEWNSSYGAPLKDAFGNDLNFGDGTLRDYIKAKYNNELNTTTQPTGIQQLREAESGEQGISEAEKATIKSAMDAMLPPPDAFESAEEYDQAEAEVKASEEYKKLERMLTGKAQQAPAPAAPKPVVVQSSPKRSIIEDTKFTYKGLNGESVTVETDFRLTEGQGAALEGLVDFAMNPKSSKNFEDLSMTLEGPAGTGKTTVIGLVKKIVEQADLGFLDTPTFIYAAPTHAATVELTSATVKQGETTAASTIQSLGSMKVDRQNPAKGPQPSPYKKLTERSGMTNIIVVDEASMLSRSDYEFLKKLSIASNGKGSPYRVIFMGDSQQIPEVIPGEIKRKLVSAAFTDSPKVALTEVKRTSDNDILQLLEEMRANITGRVPVIEGSSNIKYKRKADGLRDFITKIKEDGEGTVYIAYTNNSVSEINKFVRQSLGYEGGIKPGEVITGYLGYQSKQVTNTTSAPAGLANSVRYTVESTTEITTDGGYRLKITAKSKKLAALEEAGVEGMPKKGIITTTYIPLSSSDSIAVDTEITKEQYEKNNELISSKFKELHEAKQRALKNRSFWPQYYTVEAKVSKFFATRDFGGNYVYNISTNRMEEFDSKKTAHKKAKSDKLYVEKGVDYGYAITIHKSQGSTIKNVFFDANSIPNQGPTIVDKQGNRVTEEAHALAYVGVSRASKSLTILGDKAEKFYVLGKDTAPVIGYEKAVKPKATTPPPTSIDDAVSKMFGRKANLVPQPKAVVEGKTEDPFVNVGGTIEEYLKQLDPETRKYFREMIKNEEFKTVCKLG